MAAEEMLPTLPRGSLGNNRISVSPSGQSGSWAHFDKAFKPPIEALMKLTIISKDIDPQGLFKALPDLWGPPAPQQEVVPELQEGDDMIYFVAHARGPIEKLYEPEFLRLELDLASLVALEERPEHVDALQWNINALGTDMNTATPAPFIVPTPGNTDAAGPSTVATTKLVVSTLEPIHEQERAAVEKVRENLEIIAADLEHNSSFNAASSSSD